MTELALDDVAEQFKAVATRNTPSYFLINLTNAVPTDAHNPPPGFIVEVKPNESMLAVSYFRVPQAYVMPEGLQETVRSALNGSRTVSFIDKGKEQKHKDCPDPTQYVTRNYSYEDAVTALNPRMGKTPFFGMATKAVQPAAPSVGAQEVPERPTRKT